MTENPSKLFVYSWENMSSRRVFEAEASADRAEERLRSSAMFQRTPVQAYVREDVAEAARAEGKRDGIAFCERERQEADEKATALRRERDALAARVEALRTGIRKAMSTCARRDHGHVECWKDGRDALDADASAAGKGVG